MVVLLLLAEHVWNAPARTTRRLQPTALVSNVQPTRLVVEVVPGRGRVLLDLARLTVVLHALHVIVINTRQLLAIPLVSIVLPTLLIVELRLMVVVSPPVLAMQDIPARMLV